ncbi:MAG: hypothetical protein ACRDXX_08125 [Stackebrandtia sp.]
MKIRKTALAVSMSLLTIGGATAVVSPAFAAESGDPCGWDGYIETTDDNPGGKLCWAKDGDVIQAIDTDADGKHAVAYVYKGTGDDKKLVYDFTAKTSGHSETKRESMTGKYDLPEDSWYTVKICLGDSSSSTKFCKSDKFYNKR